MSTNMYMHVERFVDGRWQHLPSPYPPKHKETVVDWYYAGPSQNYDTMALLADVRNDDGFEPIATEWNKPSDLSAPVAEAYDWSYDEGCYSLLLSEVKAYDFDSTVKKVVRVYSPAELQQLGWLGNGDGTPYADVCSHRLHDWLSNGYGERRVPVRECVPDLFRMIELIEAAANCEPNEIRLVFWFEY